MIPEKLVNCPENYPEDLSHQEIERRFRKLLGDFENPSVPLDIEITEEEQFDEIIRQKINYNVDAGERVSAFLLFRKDLPSNAPGLLSVHGHGSNEIFPVGKLFHAAPDRNDAMQYSYIAALKGFRVLAPDALGFGERRTGWGYSTHFADEINLQNELTSRGRSLAWKSVWDNSRGIEVLEALGSETIGTIGWSGGSTQAYILAAANRKVKAAACLFSFLTLRHQFYQFRLYHCFYHFIPGMMQTGLDWDQVVSLIPPRKIFMARGGKDKGSPEPMFRSFVQSIQNRQKQLGKSNCIQLYEDPENNHEITMDMLEAALGFLRKSL